ncbi:MAG TPA: hypothetical protein VJZ00_23410 [Thermoanaerobaculia bacterium]|nr:hypothetical protein [Thermoanaerobaculia bacterium]
MKRLTLALALLLTSSAFGGEILIPAVFRGPGAQNTLWRTEVVVSNITASVHAQPVPITITLHRDNGETLNVSMPLSPMEVLDIPDAVHDWFSVENGGGIVRVTWSDDNARISARARIYNAGEHGEYGQTVAGVDTRKLVTDHFLTGLTGIGGNRTNVGISNPSTTPALVWIELFDTAGLSRGAFATSVDARSYRQFNDIFSYFGTGPLNAAMVRVSASNVAVLAYASIVRNDTGDASFVTSE